MYFLHVFLVTMTTVLSRQSFCSVKFVLRHNFLIYSETLSLWKRQALKTDPLQELKVHYSGEDGIDSGALALEFL